jgi:hypothetical protein
MVATVAKVVGKHPAGREAMVALEEIVGATQAMGEMGVREVMVEN